MDDQRADGLTDLMHVFDHELRTPLTALRGHLELLAEQADDLPPAVGASLAVMARAVDRIEATIDRAAWLEESSRALRPVS